MSDAERAVDPGTGQELLVPTWSTPEATIARAAAERAGRLRLIRFFPDYSAEWPLWEDGMIDAASLDLSPALAAAISAWNDVWQTEHRPEHGWRDEATRMRWLAEGDRLAQELARETWDRAIIVPRFAPQGDAVAGTGQRYYSWLNERRAAEPTVTDLT